MFVDSVKLTLCAGKGGNGVISWRREKFVPKGGPAGGDGGKGGSITIICDPQVLSLQDFRNTKIIKAKNGEDGGAALRKGKDGQDILLKVPVGTLIKEAKSGVVLFDLTEAKQQVVICQGGKGGKGNVHFKSPTRQAPHIATPGVLGEEKEIDLELKLIADVGFVGMPNAGKSTLMKRLTSVPVKIAPYPFTTLYPNLGYIQFDDYSKILLADIPGLIKGAHLNKGLGFSFLKHIERTSVLVFIIDGSGMEERDPLEDFITLRQEIEAYNPDMLLKPFIVALNKCDEQSALSSIKAFKERFPFDHRILYSISALNGEGLKDLVKHVKQLAQISGKKF
ncbi:MAG: GTPase ObgE [Rhabdochlamydiaceae bacterium]